MNAIETSRLLAGLEPALQKIVAGAMYGVEVAAGAEAAVQGEKAEELRLLLFGELLIVERHAEYGLEYEGPRLTEGDTLGLAAVVAGETHRATAQALTPVRMGAIGREKLLSLCDEHPALARRVMALLAAESYVRRGASPVVDLSRVRVDESTWSSYPRHLILKHRALPLVQHGGVLVVGFVDPGDLQALDDIRRALAGVRVRAVPVDALGFDHFYRNRVAPVLDRWKPGEGGDERWFASLKSKDYDIEILDGMGETVPHEERARQIPGDEVIALCNRLVAEALDLAASDIHLEPGERELSVRYRVDGRLKRRPEALDMAYHSPVVSRFKVLARMDIAERRRAQDGRLAIAYGSREIDFRLSTIPTRFGEKIVLRILDPQSILIDMERLISHQPSLKAVRWMVDQPQGMIIVAGPTGSGKTTTVYSAMLHRRQDEVNIVSIEDPVEYTIRGVSQVQVNESAGVTFAGAVRQFLRQDPDVILVGETRDPQTAKTSVEAALTGHLLLTTLHANDAVGAVFRLREMGVEPFLIANTVTGVISQRLVRKVCAHCAEPARYHRNLIAPLGLFGADESPEFFQFTRGRGCVRCNFQGFKGRTGVFETLRVDGELRPYLAASAAVGELRRIATAGGQLLPMKLYCRHLLTSGITTPEEVSRVLFAD